MKVLIGIDIGTTGLKVGCYTLNGQLLDQAYKEYALSFPQPGWVELDPEMWWDSCCEALQQIFGRKWVRPNDVAGIGVTCTNSLILLDREKQVIRPAIMQLDQRAASVAETIKNDLGEDFVFKRTGNRVAAGAFWGPTLRWLRANEPFTLERTSYYLVPTSFLVLRLSGVYSIDHSRAASTMLYDIERKTWDEDLCKAMTIPFDHLPPIYRSSDIVGVVSQEGALASGLQAGTPIITGAMDTIGALYGLGVASGSGALIMGTVGRICVETPQLDPRFMNTVTSDGRKLISMTPVNSAGVSYKWLKQLIYESEPTNHGKKSLYQFMDEAAERIRPGAEGILFHPYLTGERSPIWDPHASGSFIGLKLNHTKEHFIRAILEGVGLALAHNEEILKKECQINLPVLIAGGGGAKSRVWMQIISSMLGKIIRIPKELDAETKGAAFLAGIGIELFSRDEEEILSSWVEMSEEVSPDWEVHGYYKQLLPLFKEFYIQNRELTLKLASLRATSKGG